MHEHDASAATSPHHTTVRHTRRLTEAAGPIDQPTREALARVAQTCGPDTIDALATLLRRVRMAAPDRVAARPVVAFIRYGHTDGAQPLRGAAVTMCQAGRYDLYTVFFDEPAARWEGSNGRYDMTWASARAELTRRADEQAQP
ncbi:hypothetical protein GCM10009682_35700 [Luedemannella flava]|uniref:Uncharacterized protein n=1 Tax=Luedemannella flava TaxID=349316 RepID=A0ABP4YGR3_9ACTN